MLRNSLSVYCDMEMTRNEGWTLLVTSVSAGWKGNQVKRILLGLIIIDCIYQNLETSTVTEKLPVT